VLRVEPGELDVDRFRVLLEQGRRALASGDASNAADILRSALTLWRGAPLSDFSYESFAQPAIAELEELHLAALEERFEADLALGAHRELIGELTAAVERHPLRERLRAQLMVALYRCARQAEALEVYQEFRRTLSAELGLEPGPRLQQLEVAILSRDVSLDLPAGAPHARDTPNQTAPRMARARLRLAVGGAALLVVVVAAVIAATGGGKATPSMIAADAVGAISPTGGAIRAVVPLGTSPQALAAGDGAVWATNYEAGTMSRIDPATHAVVDTIPSGSVPFGIAVGAGMVWVANNTGQTVSRIDPAVDRVVQTIPVGSDPTGVAVGEGSVWVANTNSQTLTRIEPVSGAVLHTIALGANATGVAAGLGGVWVSDTVNGRVLRVDPPSNHVSQVINVGRGPDAISVADGSVWVANSLDGTVSRINPETNAVVATIPVGDGPAAIAADGKGVWVANQFAGTISRIDPATNTVARTITTGNRPSGITVADGLVWVGTQAEATIHHGGTLTVLTTIRIGDLDPTSINALWLLWLTNDGLTAYGRSGSGSGQVVPDLAAALPTPTDAGKTYTFQLRRGIRYSNGTPVRPQDFRRALERELRVGPGSQTSDYFANVIGGAACAAHPSRCDLSRGVVVDDHADTVTFHLVAPNPEFLNRLTLADAVAVPPGTPDHDIGLHPILATGPYTIASITREEITLVRNPYFHEWSRAARPDGYPDKMVLRTAPSASAEVTAIEHGHADVAMDPPPADRLSELETRFASQLHTLTCLCDYALILNARVAPFNDIRVRRALNYAIDRAQVARLVGAGAQPTCQTLTPWFTGYHRYCPYTLDPSPSGAWHAPDMATARRLIAASHTRGTPVTIWLLPGVPAAAARYLVTLLRRFGYPAQLRDISAQPTWYGQVADSRNRAQAFTFFDGAPYPSPSQLINIYFGCKYFVPNSPQNGNIAEFCDPRLDAQTHKALAAEANNSPDVAQLWATADRTVTDDAPQVPLVIPGYTIFVSKRVGDYQSSAAQGVMQDQLWVR
jgi:YVTN family beta-propeller protein